MTLDAGNQKLPAGTGLLELARFRILKATLNDLNCYILFIKESLISQRHHRCLRLAKNRRASEMHNETASLVILSSRNTASQVYKNVDYFQTFLKTSKYNKISLLVLDRTVCTWSVQGVCHTL